MFGNGNGKEWEKPYGKPMGMGIGYKIGNGKEWNRLHGNEREWRCKKPFPGISSTRTLTASVSSHVSCEKLRYKCTQNRNDVVSTESIIFLNDFKSRTFAHVRSSLVYKLLSRKRKVAGSSSLLWKMFRTTPKQLAMSDWSQLQISLFTVTVLLSSNWCYAG